MLKVKQFEFNMFGENTYVVYDTETLDAAVVDAGMLSEDDRNTFDDYIAKQGLKLTQIINTHMHLDHCFGANYVKNKYGVSVAANSGDAKLGRELAEQIRRFGGRGDMPGVDIDVNLVDGDYIEIGKGHLIVIQTPGHSPGGICLYCPESQFVLTGDTLFRRSIGRTDLEGGDERQLYDSIHRKLFVLPDATVVLPGHMEPTTIGEEKKFNPIA